MGPHTRSKGRGLGLPGGARLIVVRRLPAGGTLVQGALHRSPNYAGAPPQTFFLLNNSPTVPQPCLQVCLPLDPSTYPDLFLLISTVCTILLTVMHNEQNINRKEKVSGRIFFFLA